MTVDLPCLELAPRHLPNRKLLDLQKKKKKKISDERKVVVFFRTTEEQLRALGY